MQRSSLPLLLHVKLTMPVLLTHLHQPQATAAAPAAAAALWPRLPTYILQSSYLVGGIIHLALPQLALSAPDVAVPMTALHPLAFAGATGMLVNALHCLPLAATDGKVSASQWNN
jgi:membrane-associated protease RseP (regulator of RpoE activity)